MEEKPDWRNRNSHRDARKKERQKCSDGEDLLKQEREKRIAQILEEQKKAEKKERRSVEAEIQVIEKELADHRVEVEVKKKEILKLQNKELDGKGADASAISAYNPSLMLLRQNWTISPKTIFSVELRKR